MYIDFGESATMRRILKNAIPIGLVFLMFVQFASTAKSDVSCHDPDTYAANKAFCDNEAEAYDRALKIDDIQAEFTQISTLIDERISFLIGKIREDNMEHNNNPNEGQWSHDNRHSLFAQQDNENILESGFDWKIRDYSFKLIGFIKNRFSNHSPKEVATARAIYGEYKKEYRVYKSVYKKFKKQIGIE